VELTLLDEWLDVVDNMRTVFHRIMRLAHEEKELYILIVLNKYSRRNADQPPWISVIRRHLQQGMQNGLIRDADVDKTAFAVWSSFLGFNLMISRCNDLPAEEAEQRFLIQFDMILKGVLNHG